MVSIALFERVLHSACSKKKSGRVCGKTIMRDVYFLRIRKRNENGITTTAFVKEAVLK